MKSLFTSSKKYVIIESPSKKLVYGTKRAARGDIMVKKEMIAMLLAGGQGSRLGVLTQKVAKPILMAVSVSTAMQYQAYGNMKHLHLNQDLS